MCERYRRQTALAFAVQVARLEVLRKGDCTGVGWPPGWLRTGSVRPTLGWIHETLCKLSRCVWLKYYVPHGWRVDGCRLAVAEPEREGDCGDADGAGAVGSRYCPVDDSGGGLRRWNL